MPLDASLPHDEVLKLPYIRHLPMDGREVFILPFIDAHGRVMLPLVRGEHLEIGSVMGIADGQYLAHAGPNEPRDVPLPLGTTIVRHLSARSMLEPYRKVEADLLNLAASFGKYFMILDNAREHIQSGYPTLLAAEYEALIVNARALYDQLQFFFRSFWDRVIQPNRRTLPESFNDLVNVEPGQLANEYRLPPGFVTFLSRARPGFQLIRDLRDGIAHYGHSGRSFIRFDDGFGVPTDRLPWRRFPIWDQQVLRSHRTGGYLAIIAWVARELLVVIELLETAIHAHVPLPEATTDWTVFLRSRYVWHFLELDDYIRNPWRPAASVVG